MITAKRALALGLFVFLTAVCSAALPHEVNTCSRKVCVTPSAKRSLDSLIEWSLTNRLETGACVAKYSIADDDTYTVDSIIAGNLKSREMWRVTWVRVLCWDSLPSVHTHWLDASPECPLCDRWRPSTPDTEVARHYSHAPFHLVVVDSGNYIPLVVKP
jgi:hypothetical protein